MKPELTTSRVALTAGMKGGTGKSTLSVLLAAYTRSRGIRVAVFDADANVGTTFLTLRDPTKSEADQDCLESAVRFDLRDLEEAPQILRPLEIGADLSIVDMPGGSIGALESVFGSEYANGLEELGHITQASGRRITVLHMITNDRSTAASFDGFMDGFGDSADYVAVHNRGLVRRGEELTIWHGSQTRQRFLEFGGREIALPAIPPALLANGLRGLVFPDVNEGIYAGHLRFLFSKEFAEQISQVEEWL